MINYRSFAIKILNKETRLMILVWNNAKLPIREERGNDEILV